MQTSDATPKCSYCGMRPHQGVCPTVKAFEYHPDGTIKRVEFKGADDYAGTPLNPLPPITVGAAAPSAQSRRTDWHYDSQGYCDNPGRGY